MKSFDELVFDKQAGQWTARRLMDKSKSLRKTHGLQGPIDDAFLESFLCVRPTGGPRQKLANDYAIDALDRFVGEFARWLHGDVRVKNDLDVTAKDIAAHHLILFGDPGSNQLLGKIADRLPIHWTKDEIVVGKKTYSAADHVLAMIYPNPLNPRRYVVINSGHTFHEPEFRGSNALVYPRLGDYAIYSLKAGARATETTVEQSGFFDEHWALPKHILW